MSRALLSAAQLPKEPASSSSESAESEPAQSEPRPMTVSRPAPEPLGTELTAAYGLEVWKAATQASWAGPCDDAPAPLKVPDSVLPVVSPSPDGCSLAAQELSARAPASARAAIPPIRVIFTVFPSGMSVRFEALGGLAA